MNYIKLYTVLLLCSSLISCDNSSNRSSYGTFIGGEIVNPRVDFLVLSEDNRPLDTILLDLNNRFHYEMKDIDGGDYSLRHSNESQTLYLTPGDSILMYANTIEFDESLYFSGKGAEKNNFLINLFLANEQNTDLILAYETLDPQEFSKKADSILNEHLSILHQLAEKHEFPQEFITYAEGVVKYENFDLRERYTYMVNKYAADQSGKFSPEFHAYRNNVDFNNEVLQANPAYLRFISDYLINESLETPALSSTAHHNIYEFENITERINIIDSLSELDPVRDYFFKNLGSLGMVMGKSKEELVSILTLLARKGYSREGREELRQLGMIQLAFLPGVALSNVPIINHSGEEVDFEDLISRNTIVYIWSIYAPEESEELHEVMRKYQEEYPQIDFIGINVDIGETKAWASTVLEEGWNKEMEYQLGETSIRDDLFINYLNKLIFLNEEGVVVIGDALHSSPNLESRIQEFLDQ